MTMIKVWFVREGPEPTRSAYLIVVPTLRIRERLAR